MTDRDCTSLSPIEVVDSNGEVVWRGFGRVSSCSIPRALYSESERIERTVKENIEGSALQANESVEDTSGKLDIGATEESPLKRKFRRQRVEDPFMCASIGHLTAFPLSPKEFIALMILANNCDRRGKIHISQENVGEKMGVTRQRVSGIIGKLIEKGYVRRTLRKGFNTPDFSFHPEAVWFDKLIYRNNEIERIKKAALKEAMQRIQGKVNPEKAA